jgi:hypothetical protein
VNALIAVMNRLTDMDWGWWPVLFLRPQKDRDMNNALVLKLTLVFSPVIAFLALAVIGRGFSPAFVVRVWLTAMVSFFVLYRLTFAVAWNARARQVRAERSLHSR